MRPIRLCLTIVLLSLSFSFVRLVLCLTLLLPPGFSLSNSRQSFSSLSHYPASSWFLSLSPSSVRFVFVSLTCFCLSHSCSSDLIFCLTILLPSGFILSRSHASNSPLSHYLFPVSLILVRPSYSLFHEPVSSCFSLSLSSVRSSLSHYRSPVVTWNTILPLSSLSLSHSRMSFLSLSHCRAFVSLLLIRPSCSLSH